MHPKNPFRQSSYAHTAFVLKAACRQALLVEVFCVARVIIQSALNRASLHHLSRDSSSLLHRTTTQPLH